MPPNNCHHGSSSELIYEIFDHAATEQSHGSPGDVRLDSLAGMDYALTTERLVLRPVTADDHLVLLAHWTLPDVCRFLFDGAALSAAEVAQTIGESARDFAASGYGSWIVHEHGQAELAGTAGLRPLDEIGLEIFYSLAPGSWGRGYATEAARAVVDHALGTLGLAEVLAEVDEGNVASVAVVRRLGMTPFAVVPGALGPMTRYRATAATGMATTPSATQ
jgi:[ribosomal protein S5]-alanine N-acetyltransferase